MESKSVAQEIGIKLEFQFMDEDLEGLERYCYFPDEYFFIGYDGTVAICCAPLMADKNIRDLTPYEIWNGEKYLRLRREMKTGNYTEKCRLCSYRWITVDTIESSLNSGEFGV